MLEKPLGNHLCSEDALFEAQRWSLNTIIKIIRRCLLYIGCCTLNCSDHYEAGRSFTRIRAVLFW